MDETKTEQRPIGLVPCSLDLGSYTRPNVTNVSQGRYYFDQGLRLLLSYQHEEAASNFRKCAKVAPHCALARGLIALCHSPNYNFKGVAYYEASCPPNLFDETNEDLLDVASYPSQLTADYYSLSTVQKVEQLDQLRSEHVKKGDTLHVPLGESDTDLPDVIQDVEKMLIYAIRRLTCNPGVDPSIAEKTNGVPFANAMREAYQHFPKDPEIAYFCSESIMVLHAWNLFHYPTGRPVSDDVIEVQGIIENALKLHPHHVGLCHMYVHLCEMSTYPEKALVACNELRTRSPQAGHLLHMPTHIDVLVGDYDSCVRWNAAALDADMLAMKVSPQTSCITSFYFGYIVHDFHMLIYGAISGAMEKKAMDTAKELNRFLNEDFFVREPDLILYLESYATMDVHVLVRFGRWREILSLDLPKDTNLMLYRAASIHYAKSIAHANIGNITAAKAESSKFEEFRRHPEAKNRVLHNNNIADLLNVDSHMIKGEIAFFEGKYGYAFDELRKSIDLQDNLHYDEPWGKMQPVRHALGGLMLKRGLVIEAEKVYRKDLRILPRNPWSLKGLIHCLQKKIKHHDSRASGKDSPCCCPQSPEFKPEYTENLSSLKEELQKLKEEFREQRQSEWADYNVTHSCACCLNN